MQQRVLVRARGLAAFRRALVDASLRGHPLAARRRVVLLPTRAAAELLRQTVEDAVAARGRAGALLPDFVTREDWLRRVHAALPGAPPLLTRLEREVIIDRAARHTVQRSRTGRPPFQLRPGLLAAMLDFYDDLKRRQRTVRRFARVLFQELGAERGTDRGSEELVDQTCFLGFTFLAYERLLANGAGLDEHALRARVLAEQPVLAIDHLVIAVADHPSDPSGLWPADFDLIGRMRHLPRVDVVMTDEAHDAGFRDRLERELPGVVEERADDVAWTPRIVVPAGTDRPVVVSRDREDELRGVARVIRADAAEDSVLRDRTAVVFHRPLPYLYLAQQVLTDAGVPYQAFDALPLAAEPFAALLDLVLAVARTAGGREASIALLRSTLVAFEHAGEPVGPNEAGALDAVLAARRATGGAGTFPAEVDAFVRGNRVGRIDVTAARRAAAVAARNAQALEGYRTAPIGSAQVGAIAAFLRDHERPGDLSVAGTERHLRARAAVLGILDGLAQACQRHDDRARPHEDLSALLHHAIEAHTFAPRRGHGGVHLVDAAAARFGEFDRVHLVGLVDVDWSERPRRTVFYTGGLLAALGWPQAAESADAERAAFRDLLRLARHQTRLWAFQFEGDAVVSVSPLVELARDHAIEHARPTAAPPIFSDEVLTRDTAPDGLPENQARWLALRHERPALVHRDYSGFVPPQPTRPYRVSAVDRYVDCPFKYFAETVLGLEEDRDEIAGLTPLERGTLLHRLFEQFYAEWQAEGHGAITPGVWPEAVALFSRLTGDLLADLPEPDRALERARLLGSLVGRGVGERVFELEANAGRAVVGRYLERDLTGVFTFPRLQGLDTRTIEIRGKADRIDVLDDGSVRVVDYKLGRLPDTKWSVQVAVYAHCASQALEAETGQPHPVSAAMYLAFGDDRRLEGAVGERSEPVDLAVLTRASAFEGAVTNIEAGHFPPNPRRPAGCQWCGYAGVCRKEYRIADDDAADAL
jgi:RecB family exonuclease